MSDRDDLPTADQLEDVVHAALKAGDIDGVDAALRVMVVVDPRRAVDLYDTLKTAVGLAKVCPMDECPVCKKTLEPGEPVEVSFSKEGTWCNHAGWVLRTGASRDDPPILGGHPLERVGGAIPMPGGNP